MVSTAAMSDALLGVTGSPSLSLVVRPDVKVLWTVVFSVIYTILASKLNDTRGGGVIMVHMSM